MSSFQVKDSLGKVTWLQAEEISQELIEAYDIEQANEQPLEAVYEKSTVMRQTVLLKRYKTKATGADQLQPQVRPKINMQSNDFHVRCNTEKGKTRKNNRTAG